MRRRVTFAIIQLLLQVRALVLLASILFVQVVTAGETGCHAPSFLNRIVKPSAHKIYVACVDDYYKNLENKRVDRSIELKKQIDQLKLEIEELLGKKISNNMIVCTDIKKASDIKLCVEKNEKRNGLIHDMDVLNGWDLRFDTKKESPVEPEKKLYECQFEGMKCPDASQPLRAGMNKCFKEFYLNNCI